MKSVKKMLGAAAVVVLVLASTPTATAYSYNADKIAELQAQIRSLQAELARLQAGSWGVGSGAVTTGSATHRGGGDVEFRGSARPNSAQSAKVWFEFGPTRTLSYSTPKLTLTNSGNYTRNFTGYAYDLDSRTYYYRAVLEDRRGYTSEGAIESITVGGSRHDDYRDWYDLDWDDDDWNDDEDAPEVTTDDADDITSSQAELSGEVDMGDFENGRVFFVYGEDEDMVEDVEDEDQYSDIDTDGRDLQKLTVDSSFDDEDDFYAVVSGLDSDTDHYFRICVEYEDEDNDDRLECGDVEEFETDR
jgi:hypothetical protein